MQSVNNASDDIRQCPFSKPFPKFRLDMSRVKEKPESWIASASPFKNLSKNMGRSKLEQQLRKGEELVWIPQVEGVAAFSLLWSRASQLLDGSSSSTTSEIVALPDASRQLVQNWSEIVDFMNQNVVVEPSSSRGGSIQVSVLLADDPDSSSVPAIRIERTGDEPCLGPPSSVIDATTIQERTRSWVQRILVEQGICPFTKSDRKSGQGLSDVGVPVGAIAYHASFGQNVVQLQADTWRAILEMIQAGPSGKDGISSILLAAPEFDKDFDLWAGPIFAMLEAGVVAAQAQGQIGVVCFHPRYATPDGTTWPGFGHMHSVPRLERWYQESSESPVLSRDEIAAGGAWQRRTPHATINVLRADQLEAAEARRSSGQMYTENIERLVGEQGIGSEKLLEDLEREIQIGA
jgi:hypothetical protein